MEERPWRLATSVCRTGPAAQQQQGQQVECLCDRRFFCPGPGIAGSFHGPEKRQALSSHATCPTCRSVVISDAVASTSLARIGGECSISHSPPAPFFFFSPK